MHIYRLQTVNKLITKRVCWLTNFSACFEFEFELHCPQMNSKSICCLYSPLTNHIELEAKRAGIELITWKDVENNPKIKENILYVITNCCLEKCWELDSLPNLRLISNYGAGLNHLNIPSLTQKNILVSNTPGVVAPATAEVAFGLMIAVARKFKESQKMFELGRIDCSLTLASEVSGSSLGIVGLGAIGGEIAKRAKAFDMKIYYHQRNRNEDKESLYGATFCLKLDDMLPNCDFVALSCPYTEQTHHLINQAQLKIMKSGSFLINVGRGGLVNTEELIKALDCGHLAGAGLDVTDPEPLPPTHPLLHMDNVLVTPHIGTDTNRTLQKMAKLTIQNIVDVRNDKHCSYVVNYPLKK